MQNNSYFINSEPLYNKTHNICNLVRILLRNYYIEKNSEVFKISSY